MSVLVKGMEMPSCCGECQFTFDEEFLQCKITGKRFFKLHDAMKNRHPDCPLIEIQPHGDLIDRGYAIATACSGRIRTLPTTEDGENWIRVEEVRESIKNAPTIIPAEEGE